MLKKSSTSVVVPNPADDFGDNGSFSPKSVNLKHSELLEEAKKVNKLVKHLSSN